MKTKKLTLTLLSSNGPLSVVTVGYIFNCAIARAITVVTHVGCCTAGVVTRDIDRTVTEGNWIRAG